MTDLSGVMLEAPGRERPDYTLFDFPDATVTDTSTEEIEFDQALSLAGRFGRDFLGVMVGNPIGVLATEHLTIGTADHNMRMILSLNTRTGAFTLGDPESIYQCIYETAVTAPTTATSESFQPNIERTNYAEPFLYVAPRLFWRLENNMDASITTGQMDARIGSISVKLTFPLFIELLERFADVTLL